MWYGTIWALHGARHGWPDHSPLLSLSNLSTPAHLMFPQVYITSVFAHHVFSSSSVNFNIQFSIQRSILPLATSILAVAITTSLPAKDLLPLLLGGCNCEAESAAFVLSSLITWLLCRDVPAALRYNCLVIYKCWSSSFAYFIIIFPFSSFHLHLSIFIFHIHIHIYLHLYLFLAWKFESGLLMMCLIVLKLFACDTSGNDLKQWQLLLLHPGEACFLLSHVLWLLLGLLLSVISLLFMFLFRLLVISLFVHVLVWIIGHSTFVHVLVWRSHVFTMVQVRRF